MTFDKFGFGIVETSLISGWSICNALDDWVTPATQLSPNQLAVAWKWGAFDVKVHLSHVRPMGHNIYVPCKHYHIPINVVGWY